MKERYGHLTRFSCNAPLLALGAVYKNLELPKAFSRVRIKCVLIRVEANIGAPFQPILLGADLNFESSFLSRFPWGIFPGET